MITSNASWTKIPDSSDTHTSISQAENICNRLLKVYSENSPCDIRGVCKDAWVEVDGLRQEDEKL